MTPFNFPKQLFGLQNVTILDTTTIAANVSLSQAFKTVFQTPNPADEPDGTSVLGTPIYGRITFGNTDPNKAGNNYTGIDGNTHTFTNIELDCAVITVDQAKQIIKTNVQGSDGEVKEYIGLSDYNITIQGVYDNPLGPNIAPKDFIGNFQKMLTAPVSIPITNWFLNILGVHYVVVDSYSLPQLPGGYSSQVYNIRCLSDIPPQSMLP